MNIFARLHSIFDKNQQFYQQQPENAAVWSQPFEILRKRWTEIPTSGCAQLKTPELSKLSDEELAATWSKSREEITSGQEFSHRGWYHALYADSMRGKKILDIGSGFGLDSITFGQHGAQVTFVDLAESNLQVLRRLCRIFDLHKAQFLLLENIQSFHMLDNDYDVIFAQGSLHHAPISIIKPEVQELIKHLKPGGRWIQLAYPKTRWIKDGSPPFGKWGEYTDGPGTPWAEWYDLPKLFSVFEPACFEVVLCQEFHNNEFIWFDLLYVSS